MQIWLEDIFKFYTILLGLFFKNATTPTNLNLWHQYEDLIQQNSLTQLKFNWNGIKNTKIDWTCTCSHGKSIAKYVHFI
jgi:hypothetical protein